MGNNFRSQLNNTPTGGSLTVDSLTIVSNPIKLKYSSGEELDLTGIKVLANVYTPYSQNTLQLNVTSVCTFEPANGDTLTENNTSISVKFEGQTANINILVLPAWDDRGLEYNSWETIIEYVKVGMLQEVVQQQAGNFKTLELSDGTSVVMELAAINDGSNNLNDYYPANTADFVVYSGSLQNTGTKYTNFTTSTTFLNATYNKFPNIIKNNIVEKTHYYNSNENYNITPELSTSLVWIPASNEIFSNALYGQTWAYRSAPSRKLYHITKSRSYKAWLADYFYNAYQGKNYPAVLGTDNGPYISNSGYSNIFDIFGFRIG
jgi:hypothetical protein